MRCFFLLLLFLCAPVAGATTRVSHDDGAWEDVSWVPEGVPGPADTVIIASAVRGMPAGNFGLLIIRGQGSLAVESGAPMVAGLVNQGTLLISRHAVVRVDGDLRNTGTIGGEGGVQMTRDGASIAGAGTFGHLAVSGAPGMAVALADPVVLRSLAVGVGNRLLAGSHDLTVNGPYISSAPSGYPGIIGTEGTIWLNGEIDGSARGAIVIGSAPGYRPSRRGTFPAVRGTLGDSGKSVRFAASREIAFSTLIGDVAIDSGVTLRAGGIGGQGWNDVRGTLAVRGVLAATDESYRWNIDGDLRNNGLIEPCTLVLRGHRVLLRSDTGTWDPGINLIFQGDSRSELRLQGNIAVSRLTILPLAPGDSDVVVHAGRSVLKVRHRFTSDIGRGCRVVTDTIVTLWGESDGIVEGDVLFEGFWGSGVRGRYGAPGRQVRFRSRKEIVGPFASEGLLGSDPSASLTVHAPVVHRGNLLLRGELAIDAGRSVTSYGDTLRLERAAHGGGTFLIAAPRSLLDAAGEFADSVLVDVGRGDAVASVMLARTLRASRIRINLGSSIYYRAGDSMYASRELRYALRYGSGFNSASAAALPFDLRGASLFTGAISIFRYQGNGYTMADTLRPGEGYFVRFPAETVVWHTGLVANLPRRVQLRAGWNLIGGGSIPVHTSRITVEGTTLLSGYLTVLGGPTAVSVLEPGRGYWVHAAGDGSLLYNPEP